MAEDINIYEGAFQIFGAPSGGVHADPQTIEKYRGSFPQAFIQVWMKYGFASTQNGWFWIADPDLLRPVLDELFDGDNTFGDGRFLPFAYNAFGGINLWNPTSHTCADISFSRNVVTTYYENFYHLEPKDPHSRRKTDDELIGVTFYTPSDEDSPRGTDGRRLFMPALEALGPLSPGEIYGFFPAIALGGTFSLENLKRVKAVEHLTFLASLADFEWREYFIDDNPNYPFGHDRLIRLIKK